ncbi:MAG TPA: response regulator [Prolixibacteraceae bacterium]|nr:response regulator [Prolixibacteraceae bacterium]
MKYDMGEEKKYRILLAEDNAINVQVARYMLAPVSTHLDVVWNGEEAIGNWMKNGYDLILMDVKMPVLDGYETTKKIREMELERGGKRIPIIAMTATNTWEEQQNCLQAGMDGFLPKPYNLHDFKSLLKQLSL